MFRVRELVRLHRMGVSCHEVSRLLGVSPNTERPYREAVKAAGLLEGSVDDELPDEEVLRAAVHAHLGRGVPSPQPSILDELALARADGSYGRLLKRLARADVLILDDLGLGTLTDAQRHDLLEVLEDRYGTHSTVVTSQLPVNKWHEWIGEPTLADAILDRLVHNAHRFELKGPSQRKTRKN